MIPGLTYLQNFISSLEENKLIADIDSQEWRSDLHRRVQHYGYRYDYKARRVDSSMYLGQIPDFLIPFARKIEHSLNFFPDQIIINEYKPGQGIGKHIDCIPCFGPIIASLSLNSPCIMNFKSDSESEDLWLESRSLLVLEKDARYLWTHQICARTNDDYDNKMIARNRRLSVTFRTVRLND